ncbi:MAG TPA: glycoside hydrolase family 97 N-terminal domain-containing protein [Candidatus Eubacterium faecipullorum]|uniref:Glycoside hydrolase family 97 N-terminal domain-containing protein n=1 Tax=Candidatus Eubacterium faecipullorum TaxID=2838571 RepID=A0A9D1UG16_9FIRM|nr:glycoside hydrolase family 97 N-terminal domain-containing protein [Candidatus Eubacterium faecipullorum]
MGKKSAIVKTILIGILLAVLIALAIVVILRQSQKNNAVEFSAPSNAQVIDAPDKDLHLYLWLDNGVPYYSIVYNNEEIVNASQMGIDTTIGNFSSDFQQIEMLSSNFNDTVWSPLVGEKSEIQDKYNEKVFSLIQSDNKSLSVEVRAYNTGIAFRYILPDTSVYGDYTITDEQTRFSLTTNGVALCHENGQQQIAKKHKIKNLPKETNIHPPLTAEFDSGTALTLTVSKLDNYAYPLLNKNSRGLLKPIEQEVKVTENGPAASPYWTFVIGDSLADLPENKDIILNLNDEPDEEQYRFSQWVKPGKALMLGLFDETTESMKLYVDTAKKCGLDYLILDFG